VIRQLQDAKIKRNVYIIERENVVTNIAGVNFNPLYPSAYSSIYNEMIGIRGTRL
jgi:hypothetical protein